MCIELTADLMDAMDSEAEQSFARLAELARRLCPNVRVVVRPIRNADSAQINISLLHDPSGDEVVVDVQLIEREKLLWCEVTMFVGQCTCLNLASSHWLDGEPANAQVAKTIREFLAITEPHAAQAFSRLVER